MKYLSLLALACTSILTSAQKDGFIPGTIILFQDTIHGEELYEFPSKWEFISGVAEVIDIDGDQCIDVRSRKTKIAPRFNSENYLPDWFTVEFDLFCPIKGNTGVYLRFNNDHYFRITKFGVQYGSNEKGKQPLVRFEKQPRESSWKKIQVSYNKRALKVYVDDQKLVQIPQIQNAPRNLLFDFLSSSDLADADNTVKINNVRIAEGGIPLYDRLIEDGRLVVQNIHFDFNKSTIKESSFGILNDIAQMIKAQDGIRLIIEGHTDHVGSAEANMQLSTRRAESVKDYLVHNGVSSSQLKTVGHGESKPLNNGTSEEAMAMNRRVEFVLEQ